MNRNAAVGPARNLVILGLVTLLTLSAPRPGTGQGEEASGPNPGGAVIGGIAGGALGFLAGIYLGAGSDCYEICVGVVVGAIGGQALGVPLGAHIGNSGRGNLVASLGVSLLTLGLGVAGSSASGADFYLAASIAQVVGVALTEIRTSPEVSVSAGPRLMGDEVGVGVAIRW